MNDIHDEVENMFIDNYMYKNYEQLYISEEIDDFLDTENFTDMYKNITILNKSFENKNYKFEFQNESKIKNYNNKFNYYINNFNIIKTIFKNKKKSIVKKNFIINKKTNYKENKNDFNSKNIIDFINKFQNLHPLLSLKNKKFFDYFLQNIKNSIHKTKFDLNLINKKEVEDYNISSKLKNKIKKLKEDKEILKIQNKNLIYLNKRNFIIFKNKMIENEDLDSIKFKINDKKNSISNSGIDFKQDIVKIFKYDFRIDEKDFKIKLNEWEKINKKKIKILNNIINEKMNLLINHYEIIILNNKNINYYKSSIVNYICEIINFQKDFNFKLWNNIYNKIESKYLFIKTRINLIYNKKKENFNDENLSYKSINSINFKMENKPNIINKPILTKINRINKSFEIKTKNNKYFKNILIKKDNKKFLNKNKLKLDLKKKQDPNVEFILNLKEPKYIDNICDLINLENKLDLIFFKINLDKYLINLENVKIVRKDLIKEVKDKFLYKIIKFFGIKKSKKMIENKYPYLLFDYKLFLKNNLIENEIHYR